MTNAIRYLDALKARMGGVSDYRLAQILGISKQRLSKYRNEEDSFGTETAEKVAKALEIDPDEVVVAVQIDRAKTPEERARWESILKKCTSLSAALLLAFAVAGTPAPAQASDTRMCIMSNRRRAMIRRLIQSFAAFARYKTFQTA